MAYIPNAADATQPVDSVFASTAAAEFRALKQRVNDIAAGGGLGVVTPGTIGLFAGDTPLAGWLECDGSSQLRASYAGLWANAQALGAVVTEALWTAGQIGLFSSGDLATTFRLPDLRGVFVRGFNHGKVGAIVDAGRVKGNFQNPSFISDNGGSAGAMVVPFNNNNVLNGEANTAVNAQYGFITPGGTSISPLGYYAVRPANVAMMYCVKT